MGMTIERGQLPSAATPSDRWRDRREDREPVAVLLVSPDAGLRLGLRERLVQPRWALIEVETGAEALEHLLAGESDVLLLDPMLPDLEPVEFRGMVQRGFPTVQILTLNSQTGQVLLGTASPTAVSTQLSELLRRAVSTEATTGAEFLALDESGCAPADAPNLSEGATGRILPIDRPVAGAVTNAEGIGVGRRAANSIAAVQYRDALRPGPDSKLRTSPHGRQGIRGMVGTSEPMLRVYELAHMVAGRDTTVVVTGESGTGKDLVAQAIHLLSPRQRQPFVVINCAAIPEPLLEAELFGYVKGSFTGASQSRIGRIHAAHGGTLFLDEIGDMPLALQSKILRFLEQGEVQRLGGNDNLKVDVRVVAATNADLKSAVERKLFREDLYYRLVVFPIQLPPLRERMGDLPKLAKAFLEKFSPGTVLGQGALSALEAHIWPGNVRELRNVMERATILAGEERELCARHIIL